MDFTTSIYVLKSVSGGEIKMPITTSIPLTAFSQDEFRKIAYEVVQYAFEIHNKLGRMFHESVYQSTLLEMIGPRGRSEVGVLLEHQRFRKQVYLDLVVDFGCPFELKALTCLNSTHQSQLIQYLMLTGLSHGKLINFGAERVEHRFVNCLESPEQRRKFDVERVDWPLGKTEGWLEQVVVSLLIDWGTGLARSLYQEALVALAGGEERCLRFTETQWNGINLGRQPAIVLSEGVALEVTCKKREFKAYESHLRRFLSNTRLQAILWVNVTSGHVRLQRIGRVDDSGN